jgi:flotillin
MSVTLIALIIVVAIIVVGVLVLASGWKVAEPNEALIISGLHNKNDGADGKGFRIVTGRGTIVLPGIQKARRLKLNAHSVQVNEPCVTTQGIDVSVKAVVIYKIGDNVALISNASRRFLGQEDLMDQQVHDVFAGHLRSIVGGMTMEDLIRNRQELANQTRDASSEEVQKLGLIVDSLQIDHIDDPSGYIKNLGMPHVAAVQSDARIAAAKADQVAVAQEQETQAVNAENQRASRVRQAAAQAEIESANAKAAQAGPLAEAAAQQEVVAKQTELAELAAQRKEKELASEVRKPADAAAYARIKEAEAAKQSTVLAAEAAAQQVELEGAAEAKKIGAIGTAEGEAIKARREALANNGQIVIQQLIAENLPTIVEKAASAFSHVDNMTVLNGAEGVNQTVASVIAQAVSMLPNISKLTDSLVDTAENDKN